jgi:hypothetical protein
MNVLKRIFNAYITAKDFETNMQIMDGMRNSKEQYTVSLTLDQMNILTTCVSYGIFKSEELNEYLSYKREHK